MKISKYMLEARLMGINILNPDINNSELGFRLYNGQILYGIGSLTIATPFNFSKNKKSFQNM